MMKEVLLLCFIIHSRFFAPPRLSYEQLLESTCQPYKIWYKKAYVTATGFKSEIRNPSETYLEPSQRSMTELFCVNS